MSNERLDAEKFEQKKKLMRVFLALTFICGAYALTLQLSEAQLSNPQYASIAPFNGVTTPTYLWFRQWLLVDWNVFGKNYSFAASPDVFGCVPMGPQYKNTIFTYTPGGNNHCGLSESAQFGKTAGAAAGILVCPVPISFSLIPQYVQPDAFTVPMVTWANLNPDDVLSQQIPPSIVMLGAFFGGLNITLRLDAPVQTPFFYLYNQIPSGFSFFYWFSFALSLIGLTIIIGKIAIFYAAGYARSLAGYTLLMAWFGQVWVVWASLFSFGGNVPGNPVDLSVQAFWELWSFSAVLACCVLIGFYFIEVATLTSAQTIPGLDRFKIPGLVALAIIWITCIIMSFLNLYYRVPDAAVVGGPQGTIITVVFAVVAAFSLGVVLWGSFSLLRAMGGKSSIILPFVLLSIFSISCFIVFFGIFSKCFSKFKFFKIKSLIVVISVHSLFLCLSWKRAPHDLLVQGL